VSIICVYYDSQSTIKNEQSSMYNGKSRYTHHRNNTIKYFLSNEIISIDYVKSKKKYCGSVYQRFVERDCE